MPVRLATSVVHPTSVNLAYAQVALPGIGSSVSEASFPESPLRTRRICRLRGCKKLKQPDRGQDILEYRLARGATGLVALKIASQKVERSALSNSSNVEIVGWKTNDEWLALHRCADESKLQP